jgi:hypothetical protein
MTDADKLLFYAGCMILGYVVGYILGTILNKRG